MELHLQYTCMLMTQNYIVKLNNIYKRPTGWNYIYNIHVC